MTACGQKDELQQRLKAAFEEWYAVKDVPGKKPGGQGCRKESSPHSTFARGSRCEARVQPELTGPQLLKHPDYAH